MFAIALLSIAIGACRDASIASAGKPARAEATDRARSPRSRARATWPKDLPPSSELGTRRGLRVARVILHLHSPLSHDACDGLGWKPSSRGGVLRDVACLAHLRAAACTLHIDAMMVTDHPSHAAELPLERMLWMRAGDEPVRAPNGSIVASSMACDDSSHRVLVSPGTEASLMSLGLDRHIGAPRATARALRERYDGEGAATSEAFRAAGAVAVVPHTESRSLDWIRAARPDAVEIYNAHANVDPRIRRVSLGLDPFAHGVALLRFADPETALEPDLVFLAFFDESRPSLARWDALLADGIHVTGVAGTDAHESTFPDVMPDGERGDSYRRMMRWFSNHVLVASIDEQQIEDALREGRSYVAFEALGTPVGFDFVAETGGRVAEMGAAADIGATLVVRAPRVHRALAPEPGEPAGAQPTIRVRLLRVERGGAVPVAETDGPMLAYRALEPGSYRVEVRILPRHLAPFLGDDPDEWMRELVWIYSNPIRVLGTLP